jgi:hypothetical protein
MIKKIFWYFLHTQPQNNDFVVTWWMLVSSIHPLSFRLSSGYFEMEGRKEK